LIVTILIMHGVLLAIVTLLSRFAFLTNATTASSDNVGSIRMTEAQRGHPWLRFDVSHGVFDGTYGYPPFIFWLVSRLPRRIWTRARYWANYLADTASTLLVWTTVRLLLPSLAPEIALIGALAFGLNPLFLPTVEHARITAPNARSLGLLLNTLWIIVLVACSAGSDARVAIWLVPLTWLIIATSQFGMQTMAGLTVLMLCFTHNPVPFSVMTGATLVGCAIPGLGVRAVLHHKLAHWRWYRRVQGTIVNAVSVRARPWSRRVTEMLALWRHPVRNGMALGHALQTSPWWKVAGGVLPLIVASLLAAQAGTLADSLREPVGHMLALVTLASFILCALTLLPPLLFLGEAERYVEHSLAALSVLSVLLVAPSPSRALMSVTLGLVLVLGVSVAQLAHRQWPSARAAMLYPQEGFAEERALLSALIRSGQPARIATVPVKAAFLLHDLLLDAAAPGSERISFYFQHTLRSGDDHFAYLLDDTTDGYTYLRPDLSQLVGKYGINFVLVDSELLRDERNSEPILDVLRARKAVHSGRFTLYSIHDVAAAPDVSRPAVTTQPSAQPTAPVEPLVPQAHGSRAPQSARPRILAIADVPNWIFERHARTLQRRLADEFDITVQYHTQPYHEGDFDLIYALEFGLVPTAQIRSPWKYVTALRSHVSWDSVRPAQLSEYLTSHFQRTHVVSRRLQQSLLPWLPDVAYVTHGVDGERFTPVARQGRAGALRLGWAGNRQTAVKGFDEFIAPLQALPGVEIVFCGYSDRNLTLDEMPGFYASIDAYICTSASEGNNNALLEAAATSTAIITTDTGTVPEYLRHGASALIVPLDASAFRGAVELLRDDVELRERLGRAAAAAVHPAWTWSTRAEDYRMFFREALAGRTAAEIRMRASRPVPPPLSSAATLAAKIDVVHAAIGEGRIADAMTVLTELTGDDPTNDTWPALLTELRMLTQAA
jgi:glycosyltransferase involved in cell wall biosynthesis